MVRLDKISLRMFVTFDQGEPNTYTGYFTFLSEAF